jgi:DNA-binding transcriptional LysR family regulator
MADAPSIPSASLVDRLDLWQTFVRIVEAGNLSAAARQLNTTQPTVSRRLKHLEQVTGVHLIQRSTHNLRLTLEGEMCYERVKQLLAEWDGFESELKLPGHEPGGTLRMVVPHAFGQETLIAPLVDFLQRNTRISVEWMLHDDPKDFIAAGIDCAIQVGDVQDPNLVTVRLAQVARKVVMAPSLAGTLPPPGTLEALAKLPWLAIRTYYHSEVALVHAVTGKRETFRIHPRFSTDNLYALRSAAVKGLGACLGSAWVFAEDLAQGRLVEPLPMWRGAPLPLNLVFPYAPTYPARLRRFVEAMRKGLPGILEPLGDSLI